MQASDEPAPTRPSGLAFAGLTFFLRLSSAICLRVLVQPIFRACTILAMWRWSSRDGRNDRLCSGNARSGVASTSRLNHSTHGYNAHRTCFKLKILKRNRMKMNDRCDTHLVLVVFGVGNLPLANARNQLEVLLTEHHVLPCRWIAHRSPEIRVFALPAPKS